jgi:hypothetical protein
MKATHEAPPCCNQAVKPTRSRPQRGDQYWYVSHSVFDVCSTQWDTDGTDEGRWHVGNVFGSLEHAAQARDTLIEVVLTFHQEHASSHVSTPFICSPS